MLFISNYSCKQCGSHGLNISETQLLFCPGCGARDVLFSCVMESLSSDWNQFKGRLG